MNQDPIAALEIGTSRTVLAVGDPIAPGRIRVTAHGAIPSAGVRKSRITNIGQAGASIGSVLRHVENDAEAGYRIGQVVVALSGAQVTVKESVTEIDIDGPVVTENDVDTLEKHTETTEGSAPVLLDRAEIAWDVGSNKGVSSPIGLSGRHLVLHALVVEGGAEQIADTRAACSAAGVDVSDAFFSATCAAEAVLTDDDRTAGSLVIDLGGGSTNWCVVSEGRTVHAGTLGVGGGHVENDIRQAFSVSRAQAAELVRSASAVILPARAAERIPVSKSITALCNDSVPARALDTVVNARMAETLAIIRDNLDGAGLLHRLNAGVVLTGGGAYLTNVNALAESVFSCRARTGALLPGIEGLGGEHQPASYATIAGLLLMAQKNAPEDGGLIDSFFGSFGKVFRK